MSASLEVVAAMAVGGLVGVLWLGPLLGRWAYERWGKYGRRNNYGYPVSSGGRQQ